MGKILDFPEFLHKQLPNNEWWLTMCSSFGRLVASPLGIGWIDLDDGSRVQGFRQAAALVPDQYVWRIDLVRQM